MNKVISVIAAVFVAAMPWSPLHGQESVTLAVGYFDNNAGAELEPLRKGLADMLITDLSHVDGFRMVERRRLETLLREIELGTTPYVDPTSAQKLGRGLGAEYILVGAYTVSSDQIRIDARLVHVETSEVTLAETVSGATGDLFALEKTLAMQVAESLDRLFRQEFTSSPVVPSADPLKTLLEYSRALDAYDQNDGDAARRLMEKTIGLSPGFALPYFRLEQMQERLDELMTAKSMALPAELLASVAAIAGGESAECDLFGSLYWELVNPITTAVRSLTIVSSPYYKHEREDYASRTLSEMQDSWLQYGLAKPPESLDEVRRAIGQRLLVAYGVLRTVLSTEFPDGVCKRSEDPRVVSLNGFLLALWWDDFGAPDMRDSEGAVIVARDRYRSLFIGYAAEYLGRYPRGPSATMYGDALRKVIAQEQARRSGGNGSAAATDKCFSSRESARSTNDAEGEGDVPISELNEESKHAHWMSVLTAASTIRYSVNNLRALALGIDSGELDYLSTLHGQMFIVPPIANVQEQLEQWRPDPEQVRFREAMIQQAVSIKCVVDLWDSEEAPFADIERAMARILLSADETLNAVKSTARSGGISEAAITAKEQEVRDVLANVARM